MKKLQGKQSITHDLQEHYEAIKSFKKKKAFINSPFYNTQKEAINSVINGLEWDNTISPNYNSEDKLRVVSWNIERGKQLDAIISYFNEDPELSKADIIMAIECDNGMGRTNNRNVTKELAEALGMNYCFAPSYLVLGKGAMGETDHSTKNTTALHGTAILSRYPIQEAKGVEVPPVKEVFHSSEKRLGCKKGLVAQLHVNGKTIALGAIHIDLSSTAKDRANQLSAVMKELPKSDIELVGGDWNCGTFNLRRKGELVLQILYKLLFVGVTKSIHHYMTPELKFDKPIFELLVKNGFDYNSYNDRKKGTIYYEINNLLTLDKTNSFIPKPLMNYLLIKVKPWKGLIPLKIDWLAGKGGKATNAQTIEKPTHNDILLSDHNPIYIDLAIN